MYAESNNPVVQKWSTSYIIICFNTQPETTFSNMTVAYSALLSLLALPSALASSGTFNYHSDSPFGPSNWGSLNISDNQCSGQKNSPIAVETTPCDVKADYTMLVSNVFHDELVNALLFSLPLSKLTNCKSLQNKNRTETAPLMT